MIRAEAILMNQQMEFDYATLYSCPVCGMPTSDAESTICGRYPECRDRARAQRQARSTPPRCGSSGGDILGTVTIFLVFGALYLAVEAANWFFER